MKIFKDNLSSYNDNGNFESAVYDLMSALMIVFMLIAFSSMLQTQQEAQKVQELSDKYKNEVEIFKEATEASNALNNKLDFTFSDKLNELNMEIISDNTIRFKSPELFFDTGKSELTNTFKNILDEFFPLYIDLIYNNYKDVVKEIRIEGHTSSEWAEYINESENEAYFNNMKLSQDRALAVLEYIINMPSSEPYRQWLINNMTTTGLSSSKPIINFETGLEDKEKSRRVEFKIITDYKL
ncbi:hypothetical protein AN641_04420 [Candidatus Epulonipiscioides gigas]|nr:hypothetical protein AN641_04420 [Epulopiscium sp. SCG-C07WGA-EpuloA2]